MLYVYNIEQVLLCSLLLGILLTHHIERPLILWPSFLGIDSRLQMFPCASLFFGFKHCLMPPHIRCEKVFPHTTLHMLSSHFLSCLLTQVLQLIFSLISFSGANPSSLLSSLATFFWLLLYYVALVSLKLMGRNVPPASVY